MTAPGITVRLATNADCALLPPIELSANQRFADLGMDDVTAAPARTPEVWEPHCASSGLWVAVDERDQPFGFLATGPMETFLFLYELSVAYDRQRQGAGHALLRAAESDARDLGLRDVFLTTFRDVPFNAPFYARQGYQRIADEDLPPELWPVMDAERRRWSAPGRQRCAMRKAL